MVTGLHRVVQTKEVGGNPDFYQPITTTGLYTQFPFGGMLSTITIRNDSTTDSVQFSWDGATLGGEVLAGESIAIHTDNRSSIYIKATTGGDKVRLWGWASAIGSGTVNTSGLSEPNLNVSFEDLSFIAAESPVLLDINAGLGKNSVSGWLICDGVGDIIIEFSRDGATYGDPWRMVQGETVGLDRFDIDTLRITHTGTDSSYRVVVI